MMIANMRIEVFSGTPAANAWGDTTFTEGAPVVVAGHFAAEQVGSGSREAVSDGASLVRCRVRLPSTVPVDSDTVFRIDGVRWKPVFHKRSRMLQRHTIYICQRME